MAFTLKSGSRLVVHFNPDGTVSRAMGTFAGVDIVGSEEVETKTFDSDQTSALPAATKTWLDARGAAAVAFLNR